MVRSLRGRFLVTASILVALVLPAVINTENVVSDASITSKSLIADYRQLQSLINDLEQSLQSTESKIYHYSIQLDDVDRQQVFVFLGKAKRKAKQLKQHSIAQHNPQLETLAQQLNRNLKDLEVQIYQLLRVLDKVETRYPAAPILLNNLQPTSAEFMSALETAIDEGAELINEPQQLSILNLFRDLRYAWSQQISSVRVYIANRSGIFGQPQESMANNAQNRRLYMQRVRELLQSLKLYDSAGLLGFQQSAALQKMLVAIKRYERYFQQAATIYTSDQWRADIPLLDNHIRPIYNQLWGIIYRTQAELDGLLEGNTKSLIHISDSLSNKIILFMVFVMLAMLFGYLLLEYMIRRPIMEVTKALNAEGQGESYLPNLSSYTTRETDVMVEAFRNMREQVRSRQTRLESILDNAGEGIITVDDDGIIENFNTAAQQLFGYSAEEAIGEQVQEIIKLSGHRIYGDFLDFCRSPFSHSHLSDTVISATHRDGTVFPLSLNVNDMMIEDRHLYIALVEDISERVALMDNLRTMAEHDSLTGLYNREYFMIELDRVIENIKRGVHCNYALLYIDLDNFKFVNDTLGHMAGDQVLVEVTEMLSKRHRKSDLLARLGGDEFAILISGANSEQVLNAAESHRKLLADYQFKYEGKIVNIGCTIGITLFGEEPQIKEDILVQADIACHIAKRAGRNRVHVYKSDDKENMAAMSEDMGWASRIKRAIEQDQFLIACQPIVNSKTMEVCRHEVLIRMQGDDGNIILPAGFLPSAERFGLMHGIDRWLVDHAIKLLGERLRVDKMAHFAINLSAKSLDDPNMFATITEALGKYHVEPRAVTFEITENVAISNLTAAIEFLRQLRHLGCKTALDDFGVGYSSFAYLKDLPVDYVKIDGSFVRNMHRDMLQFTLVRSMNDIAHALGKKTVAEYVDSEAAMAQLIDMGVDFIQGYFVGKPEIISPEMNTEETKPYIKLVEA
jgi:diguanylate cyclase (GGDEF)-like protein/PAS domain S-box-containing protein